MNVEVVERKMVEFGPTHIPEGLVEHFQAIGRQLRLVHSGSGNLGLQRGYGREVVLFDELPEPVQRIVRSSGFDNPKKHDGEIHVGDCILVSMTNESHQFWESEWERRRVSRENDQDFLESVNEAVDRFNMAAGGQRAHVTPLNDSKLSDHVKGGPDLAAEILAAEQARRK